jgi:hypothetical protein
MERLADDHERTAVQRIIGIGILSTGKGQSQNILSLAQKSGERTRAWRIEIHSNPKTCG